MKPKPARIVMTTSGFPPVTRPVLRGGATGNGPHRAYPTPHAEATLDEMIAELRQRAEELGYEVVLPVLDKPQARR